jgi:hypothetical protein
MQDTELRELLLVLRAARRVIYRVAPDATDPKRGTKVLQLIDATLKKFQTGSGEISNGQK